MLPGGDITVIMPPPGGIKRWSASVIRLSVWCRVHGSNSKTKRPRKTKLPHRRRLPHRLQGQKSRSRAGAYCGGHLAAQLVIYYISLK